MQGELDMSFNKIINLSNLTDLDQNDVCSYGVMRRYATSRKHIITVLADVKTRKWCGYTIPTSGRITHVTLTTAENARSIVHFLINDRPLLAYQIIKPINVNKVLTVFENPLELQEGDVLNFKIVVNGRPRPGVVSVLIELDL